MKVTIAIKIKIFMNKISIVTPVFNGEKYIEQTIISVLNQTYQNLEYIVVDGGSTDKTIDIIEKYRNKISKIIYQKEIKIEYPIKFGTTTMQYILDA